MAKSVVLLFYNPLVSEEHGRTALKRWCVHIVSYMTCRNMAALSNSS